jgi:hypothetical protein
MYNMFRSRTTSEPWIQALTILMARSALDLLLVNCVMSGKDIKRGCHDHFQGQRHLYGQTSGYKGFVRVSLWHGLDISDCWGPLCSRVVDCNGVVELYSPTAYYRERQGQRQRRGINRVRRPTAYSRCNFSRCVFAPGLQMTHCDALLNQDWCRWLLASSLGDLCHRRHSHLAWCSLGRVRRCWSVGQSSSHFAAPTVAPTVGATNETRWCETVTQLGLRRPPAADYAARRTPPLRGLKIDARG